MGNCFRCASDATVGGLCGEHAAALAQCADVTAEQIVSQDIGQPVGWLVDQWGCTHPLGSPSLVGRSPQHCSTAILHHGVSALHAQLELADGRWSVVDRGSLNGTFVNGERVRTAVLSDGDRVAFGSVAFYLATGALKTIENRSAPGRTVPTRSSDLVFAARLRGHEGEIELTQRIAGGVARIGDELLELARLEFALVKVLVERRRKQPDPELCFVSSEELARALDFRSRDADGENVRELVRRVRRKLKQAGIVDLIESRQGVGYRVSWPEAPP
jgi:hypothetical protein